MSTPEAPRPPAAPEAAKAAQLQKVKTAATALKTQVATLSAGARVNLEPLKLEAKQLIAAFGERDPRIVELRGTILQMMIAENPAAAALATSTFDQILDQFKADFQVNRPSLVATNLDRLIAVLDKPATSPAATERSAEFKSVHEQLQKLGENVKQEDLKNLTDAFKKLLDKPEATADISLMEGLLARRFGVEGIGGTLIDNILALDLKQEAVQKRLRDLAKASGLPEPPPAPPKGPAQMAQKVTLGIDAALTKLPPSVFEMFKQWAGMDEKQTVTFLGNLIRNFIADFALFITPGTIAEQQIRAFGRAMHKENQVIAYMNVKGSAPSAALVAEWNKEFTEWEKYTRLGKNNKIDVAMLSMPTMLMLEDEKSAKEYRDEFAKVKQEIDKRLTAPPAAPTTAPAETPKKIGGVDFIKGEFAPGDAAQKFEYADKKVHIDKKKLFVEPDGADKSYLLRAQGDAEPTGIKLLAPVTGEKPEEVQVEISTASGKTVVKLSDIVDKIVADRTNPTRKTKVIVKADKTIDLA